MDKPKTSKQGPKSGGVRQPAQRGTRRRRARRETDSRKRWLFFGSLYIHRAAIAFLLLFLLNPGGASAMGVNFTSVREGIQKCMNNLQLTRASHTTGSRQFKYTWEGQCWDPCTPPGYAGEKVAVKVGAFYDRAKQEASESLKFTGGLGGKVQMKMTWCQSDPFKYSPSGCSNRLIAFGGCLEEKDPLLIPFSGFFTEGMVPKNVTYSEGGSSPPPPPPPKPPKGVYEVKRILSPAGLIPSQYTEITFALEPRRSDYPPIRIIAQWELSSEKKGNLGTYLKKGKGTEPIAKIGWKYYDSLPGRQWDELPRQIPISFFPSRKETYRVRVYASTPDGKWIGPTEWSYFSFAPLTKGYQQQLLQPPPPMPDLTVEDFKVFSQTTFQGWKGWLMYWKFKNVGEKPVTDPKYRIECDVITGSDGAEEMCTEIERTDNLPGNHLPGQTFDSPATDVVREPEPEELFKLRITAIIDPEDDINEGVLGENNNELVSFIQNSELQIQQKSDKFYGGMKKKSPEVKPGKKSQKKARLVVPSIVLLSGKRSYSTRENVMFMFKGEPAEAPQMECFEKGRWTTKCPKVVLRKMGSGAQTRYILSASKAGKYRLRVGNILSNDIEVKPVKSAKLKAKKTPKVTPKLKKKIIIPKEPKKKKKLVPFVPKGAPRIRINKSAFTTPAAVKLTLKADSKFKVRYILEQKFGSQYRKVQTLRSLRFDVTAPGYYRVKASYEGGHSDAFAYFEVKPKIEKKIQKKPIKKIKPKPPLVPKKRIIQIQ